MPSIVRAPSGVAACWFRRGTAADVPVSVVKKARKLMAEGRNEFSARDRTWVVFDRDAHPSFVQAINEAETQGISVAYSNPCFELWVVLHYRDDDGPAQRSEIQRRRSREGHPAENLAAPFTNSLAKFGVMALSSCSDGSYQGARCSAVNCGSIAKSAYASVQISWRDRTP